MLLGGHAADARGAALVDVAEEARAANTLRSPEDPVAAGSDREHLEEFVDRAAYGPCMGVWTEVPSPLALRLPDDRDARELLAHRHGEIRVGLVIAEFHIETRVVLLDPGVLQGERLDLVANHHPVDIDCGRHHGSGAGVHADRILEIARQPRPEVSSLADVDHLTASITKPIDAGIRRYGTRSRAKRRPARGSGPGRFARH